MKTMLVKMLKPIRYDIRNGSVALRQDNGTIHVEAVLENGSATRDCSLDITPNDEVNGNLVLPDGKKVEFHGIRRKA